jgi:beta-ribofuranosylaminobenzene 5'-phosphate synthase
MSAAMIRLASPSRLHFGLFRLPSPEAWPDLGGNFTVPARHFGGVGLMIDKPGIQMSAAPAKVWSATGPLAERALAYAHEFLQNSPDIEPQAFALNIEHCAPEHVGLGTGTQLGLTVAKALATALGRPDLDAVQCAGRVGRGRRSGIGVHGFQHGGLLVDGGKNVVTALAPLVARHEFPADWAILLVLPQAAKGVSGPQEHEVFEQLAQSAAVSRQTDALCRLVLLGILPALVERDLPAFGAALYDFNRRAGEMFASWQGGIYTNPRTEAIVSFIRDLGIHGVGQTSWGPAVFAIDLMDRMTRIAVQVRKQFAFTQAEVIVCGAANQGARLLEY